MRLLTWLAEKTISFSPSLLKSPMPTPPPMYPNSLMMELDESVSRMSLLKWMPDSDEFNFENKVSVFAAQPVAMMKTKNRSRRIKGVENISCVLQDGCNNMLF